MRLLYSTLLKFEILTLNRRNSLNKLFLLKLAKKENSAQHLSLLPSDHLDLAHLKLKRRRRVKRTKKTKIRKLQEGELSQREWRSWEAEEE